ncbi:reverse transcriptase domain-containing protein [Tanacetum coccineum]
MILPYLRQSLVSPIHCVPKKGRNTVVVNEENDVDSDSFGYTDGEHFNEMYVSNRFHDMVEKTRNLYHDFSEEPFYGQRGHCPRHKISNKGIEVDKAKIDVIAKLPHPTTSKELEFSRHPVFTAVHYRISQNIPTYDHLLEKNTPFIFSDDCIRAFQTLKDRLTEAPILIAPNWDLPFELMCDAKRFRHSVYASRNFSLLIMEPKSIVQTDHSALTYHFQKKACQARFAPMVFSLQEPLELQVIDTKRSREPRSRSSVPDWKTLIRRCVHGNEALEILSACHNGPTGGHGANLNSQKDLWTPVFFWPTIYKDCPRVCHRTVTRANGQGRNFTTDEMPQNSIQVWKSICHDCPDCEDSQFCHSSRVSHPQLHLGIRYPNLID